MTWRHGNFFYNTSPLWQESNVSNNTVLYHESARTWSIPLPNIQLRRALIFSLLITSTNCWTNSPVVGDLRCTDAHVNMNGYCAQKAVNTLRPRQNGRHFADDIFKCILLNENVWIPNEISLKFVPTGPINNIPSLVQIMAWCRPGNKPLSEPMMVSSLTHVCVTWPQWVDMGMSHMAFLFLYGKCNWINHYHLGPERDHLIIIETYLSPR